MCFIITLPFFLHAADDHGRRWQEDVIIFCLPVHFIIYHDHLLTCGGNLIIDSLRMPAADHSSGHLFVDDGKAMTSCKTKRQFIMHRHNSPAHILGSQKLYATGGARKQGRN